jgi:phage terminase large subunit-like protein
MLDRLGAAGTRHIVRKFNPVALRQIHAVGNTIVSANWNHAFLEELRDFPFGRKDDQVDALSRAFAMLTSADAPARQLAVPYLAR